MSERSEAARTTTTDLFTNGSEKDRPTSAESVGAGPIHGGDGNGDGDGDDEARDREMARHITTDSTPELTLSRAKAVALVATVTGASFLNVSASLIFLLLRTLFV